MTARLSINSLTSDELDALVADRDFLARKVEALEAGLQETAADALKHKGCHMRLMAQVRRAEQAAAALARVRRVADWLGRNYPGLDHDHRIIAALDAAGQPDTVARVREVRAWLAAEADRCRLLAEDELPAEIRVATNSMATAHRLAVRLLDGALGGGQTPVPAPADGSEEGER